MTADVYVYHSGQPGIPQLSGAGGAGELDALLYAIGVTGFGAVTLDSLTQTGGVATATRAAGLTLAEGLPALPGGAPSIPIIIQISGSTNGWDGEYQLNAVPASGSCTFACDSGLPSPATGTITLKRAPAGMTRLASAANKAVYQFKDVITMPGYLMVDDSNAQYAGLRLAETAADPVDYATMVGLCPTVAQIANPGIGLRKTDGGGGAARPFVFIVWKGGMYYATAWPGGSVQTSQYDVGYIGAKITRKAADGYPGIVIGNAGIPSGLGNLGSLPSKGGNSSLGHYAQRSFTQLGSSIIFVCTGNAYGTVLGSGTYADPNPSDNAEDIWGPIGLNEGTNNSGPQMGFMPLLWDPVNSQNRSSFDVFTNMVALPGRSLLLLRCASAAGANSCIALDITGPE